MSSQLIELDTLSKQMSVYFFMTSSEHPDVRRVDEKNVIIKRVDIEESSFPEDIQRDKYASVLILPMIEMGYGRPEEMYSLPHIKLLQREIEYFKEFISYDDLCKEIDEDMRRLGMKRHHA